MNKKFLLGLMGGLISGIMMSLVPYAEATILYKWAVFSIAILSLALMIVGMIER